MRVALSTAIVLTFALNGCATGNFDGYASDVLQPALKTGVPALRACYDKSRPKGGKDSTFKVQYLLHPETDYAKISNVVFLEKEGVSPKMEQCLKKAVESSRFPSIGNGRDTQIQQKVIFRPGEWETSSNIQQMGHSTF